MYTPPIFDYSPKVKDLPKEPLPTHIVKRFNIDGKIQDKVVLRKSKCGS